MYLLFSKYNIDHNQLQISYILDLYNLFFNLIKFLFLCKVKDLFNFFSDFIELLFSVSYEVEDLLNLFSNFIELSFLVFKLYIYYFRNMTLIINNYKFCTKSEVFLICFTNFRRYYRENSR